MLEEYEFPGNVRELHNLIERACLLADGDELLPEHFPDLDPRTTPPPPTAYPASVVPLAQAEREYLRSVVARFQGSRSELASVLGLSPRTMYRKLQEIRPIARHRGVAASPTGHRDAGVAAYLLAESRRRRTARAGGSLSSTERETGGCRGRHWHRRMGGGTRPESRAGHRRGRRRAHPPRQPPFRLQRGSAQGRIIGRHCFEVCHGTNRQCPGDECPLAAAYARMPMRRAVHIHRTAGVDRLTRIVARPLADAPGPDVSDGLPFVDHVSAVPHRTSLVGRSAAFRRMVEQLDRVAEAPIPLLIVGEPGTGKELVARTLHRMSRRLREPFVVVDCPFPDSALEGPRSDVPLLRFGGLLGWAGHGTLFVDHLLALTPFQQALLLRLIDATMNRGGRRGAVPARARGSSRRAKRSSMTSHPTRHSGPTLSTRCRSTRLKSRPSVTAWRTFRSSPRARSTPVGRDRTHLAPQSCRSVSAAAAGVPGNVRELAYVVERAALAAAGSELGREDFAA